MMKILGKEEEEIAIGKKRVRELNHLEYVFFSIIITTTHAA